MHSRITVTTPVDDLLFWKMEGEEGLSMAWEFNITLLSQNPLIDRQSLLGQSLTVNIPLQSVLHSRYLHGKITRVKVSDTELSGVRYTVYELTMEPDLWPLKRDRNLRIFQDQTVPQMIKTLLEEYKVTVEDKLSADYRIWEYCVQYQESSFAFISRLMELEGIYYFFRHEQDKHIMVLADSAGIHQPFSGYESIPWQATPSGGTTTEEGVSQWIQENRVTPGIYSLDDYDFRKPNAWMLQAQQNAVAASPGEIDVYDWPGHFTEHSHGEFYARIRQQVWQVEHQQISGTGTALGLAPGHTFTLTDAPESGNNGDYLVTWAHYRFEENRYASGQEGEPEQKIGFKVVPAELPFRPAPSTPWPRTHGPQTARVTGPENESIWTDKYGRVKVKFHWDRLGKEDDTSSCWVRVSSAWAGQGFGGVQIPRVNDEVVIDFINGDPDRPIITGRVYNEANMPPWQLPDAATQMGFLSRSKDGSAENANALRFDDKLGEEQVWLQAERNMDIQVKKDVSSRVEGNRSSFIGQSEEQRVAENFSLTVQGESGSLAGKNRLDAAVEVYELAAGSTLRLVCGKSAIELNASGQISLTGSGFNIFSEGGGQITTQGGKLNLNTPGAGPGTQAPGTGLKDQLKDVIKAKFPA